MSRTFGPITQNGYVVTNLDAAIEHWATKLGVGPWFELDPRAFEDMRYRGELVEPRLRIALANSGNLQIELIQPLDDCPTPYRDFLWATGNQGGLQHVSTWPDHETFDRLVQSRTALFSGQGGGTRFAYFADTYGLGTMMEIADLSDGTRRFFEKISRAADTWDGKEAIVQT